MILWEQRISFCTPHNKFRPPPAAQKKSFSDKLWGWTPLNKSVLSHFGGLFCFTVFSALDALCCQEGPQPGNDNKWQKWQHQEQEQGYSPIITQQSVQIHAAFSFNPTASSQILNL